MTQQDLNEILYGLLKAHFMWGGLCICLEFLYFSMHRQWAKLRLLPRHVALYILPAISFFAVFLFVCTTNNCLRGSGGGGRFSIAIVVLIVLVSAAAFWFALYRQWIRTPTGTHEAYPRKVVLYFPNDCEVQLDKLVAQFLADGVVFVGVVGKDCVRIEKKLNELLIDANGERHHILTSAHPDSTVEEAIEFARSLSGRYKAGDVQLVEF